MFVTVFYSVEVRCSVLRRGAVCCSHCVLQWVARLKVPCDPTIYVCVLLHKLDSRHKIRLNPEATSVFNLVNQA